MWSGTSYTRRRGRRRESDNEGSSAVPVLRHRNQRGLHVPFRAHRYLNMTPHITVGDLRVGWGTRVLLEHVSFQVERGTIFAILGGSGSGKSTLLRYLIGLEQPQAGRIDIDRVGEPHRCAGMPPF